MSVMRSLLLWGSRNRWLEEQFRRRKFAKQAVARFMPGEAAEDALKASQAFLAKGIPTILTKLGENLTDLNEADAVTRHYLGVLDLIAERRLDTQISVKLTQLGLDLDREAARKNFAAIALRALERKNFVWIDMENSSYVDATLDLFRRTRATHSNVGVCLQSYLYRTPADFEALVSLAPAIRLVKGAYNESPSVAFPRKADTDAQFLSLAKRMLQADARKGSPPLGFGTHDMRLVALIAQHAESIGLKKNSYEVQMLYGIRAGEQERLVRQGHNVRVLISYGSAWFAWYMRRLAERPANVWFVLKAMLR
jgi:proline dehydrogenase